MSRTLVALLAAVSLTTAFGGCKTNPSTGRSQLLLVSADDTAKMGEQAKPELTKEYGGEVKSPELRQYIEQVGRRLANHTEPDYKGTKWEFTTLDSDVINAFALPGGKVFMSRGLLEQLHSEAAVAAVLGHEIGHVTARHMDERISHAMVVQGIGQAGSAAAGMSSSSLAQLIPMVVGAGGQGYLLKFSRDQESEADRQGLKYMTKSGYDPKGMVDVMHVLIDASKGNKQWEILSTHPDPQHRLEQAQHLIDTEYAYTKDNPKFKKFENRFEKGAAPFLPKAKSADAESSRMGVVPPPALWCAHCRALAEAKAQEAEAKAQGGEEAAASLAAAVVEHPSDGAEK